MIRPGIRKGVGLKFRIFKHTGTQQTHGCWASPIAGKDMGKKYPGAQQQRWESLVFINFHSFCGQSHPKHPAERITHLTLRWQAGLPCPCWCLKTQNPALAEFWGLVWLFWGFCGFFSCSFFFFFPGSLNSADAKLEWNYRCPSAEQDADKQLATSQWLVTSGAFWDAKSAGGLLQNLQALTSP